MHAFFCLSIHALMYSSSHHPSMHSLTRQSTNMHCVNSLTAHSPGTYPCQLWCWRSHCLVGWCSSMGECTQCVAENLDVGGHGAWAPTQNADPASGMVDPIHPTSHGTWMEPMTSVKHKTCQSYNNDELCELYRPPNSTRVERQRLR
jgi:hypothetical protein